MKSSERSSLVRALQSVPEGVLEVTAGDEGPAAASLSTGQFRAITAGKGRAETYDLFPGIQASFNLFLAPEIRFHHEALPTVLEIYYCRRGRVGWNMHGGSALYLGAGDLTVHSMACCADSTMMFPLGYLEGLSLSVDPDLLPRACPQILPQAGALARSLQERFCNGIPHAFPAGPPLEHIFAPLFAVPASRRLPLLRLKALELLLFLCRPEEEQELPQYVTRQTELIRQIHRQLTEQLDRRVTIEELSRQYLLNTSTLKEVFKAVYGQPIATYMKEYRVHRAMELLRQTDASIGEIAARVGYETQGKFSKAFRDVTGVLPTEYRKTQRK